VAAELYVGIMSGTSLDGIDAALVEIADGRIGVQATYYLPYKQQFKEALLSLHRPADNEIHHAQVAGIELARLYAAATVSLLKISNTSPASVRAIGCHGQTVRHRPESGYTLQLGNAALLAELAGISVVSDFRSRDIAAGGQGAPLVPAFHDKVMRHPAIHRVIVNIGGISNLTDLAPEQPTGGFDCGPGNLLMDAWIARHQDREYDENGEWAESGQVIETLLQKLAAEPFFDAAPPKSSGRDLFNLDWLDRHLLGNEAPVDVQAPLLALTSASIADAIRRYCGGAREVYLCGGGARNRALIASLRRALPECQIGLTDALGISVDWVEAIAFAWLARQAIHNEPANLPAVTGARHPCILGAIYPA
jgi:anhydro-N-acetylmuramic acid kinase